MSTGLITHDEYLLHDNGPLHPERPQRLRAIWSTLVETGLWPRMAYYKPRPATAEQIAWVHEPEYIDHVRAVADEGGGSLDPDTHICPASYRIARLSAGGALVAVEAVLEGEVDNALVLTRPPGHHARPSRGMGFCLFNNIALSARAAQQRGIERVFILDWDVHHGNGTQEAFYEDPNVFFCSLHQVNWYPFSGAEDERGAGAGEGATLNLPLRPGRRDADYLQLLDEIVAPAVRAFSPELILVSAGQDTHERDPLGQMRVTNSGFGQMTRRVLDWAAEFCQGRVVACLEGGYDLEGLAGGVANIAGALLGDAEPTEPTGDLADHRGQKPENLPDIDGEDDVPHGW
ncbi:MAG: histone deacetylase [Armatimonadetes bacterium]|nr:histone deacetylase [Armatimonadota bacterium]